MTWEDISVMSDNPKTMRFVQVVAKDQIIVSGDSEVFRSTDEGGSYEEISSLFLTGRYFNEAGQGIGFGSGNVYSTTDFGVTWEVVTNKAERSLNQAYVSETGDVWLVGFRGIIWNDKEVFGPITTNKIQLELSENVQVFPNPTTGQINISIDGNQYEKVKIELFDVVGKKVHESKWIEPIRQSLQARFNLESGSYIMTIKSDRKLIGRKKIQFIK